MKKLLFFCISLMMMCSISISTALAEEVHSTSAIDPYIYELMIHTKREYFRNETIFLNWT